MADKFQGYSEERMRRVLDSRGKKSAENFLSKDVKDFKIARGKL